MSQKTAQSFLKDLEGDQKLQNKIVPAFDMERGEWKYEQVVSLAAEEGYSFSMDDLKGAAQEIYGTDELSEAQLEMISGGGCCCSCCIVCCCCCQTANL